MPAQSYCQTALISLGCHRGLRSSESFPADSNVQPKLSHWSMRKVVIVNSPAVNHVSDFSFFCYSAHHSLCISVSSNLCGFETKITLYKTAELLCCGVCVC